METPIMEPHDPIISTIETTGTLTNAPKKYVKPLPMILNILNTVLGAGILSIPNSFTFCGLIPSVCMLTASAIFTYISTALVVKMSYTTSCESIGDLALQTTGKIGSNILSISLLCFCYSCMTAYIIMSTEIIQGWILLAGLDTSSFGRRAIVVVVFALAVPIALTVPRKLTFLNYASFFCFIGLGLFLFGMVFKGIVILPKDGIDPTVESGVFGIGLFNALGIHALSFSLAGVIIPLIRHMEPDSHKRFVVTGSAFFISFIVSLIPGVTGYLIFGVRTKPMILSNFPNDDILFNIVRFAILLVLTASYPAIGLTLLTTLSRLIYKSDKHELLPWSKRIVVLLIDNSLPLLIAVFLPNVRPAMAIGGAFGAGISNLVMPPLMWVRMSPKKWYEGFNLVFIILFIIGTIACSIATYQAVLDAIHQFTQ
jgi:amino acid permease